MAKPDPTDTTRPMCQACVDNRRAAGKRFTRIKPRLERDDEGNLRRHRDTGRPIPITGTCSGCDAVVSPILDCTTRWPDDVDPRSRGPKARTPDVILLDDRADTTSAVPIG